MEEAVSFEKRYPVRTSVDSSSALYNQKRRVAANDARMGRWCGRDPAQSAPGGDRAEMENPCADGSFRAARKMGERERERALL